jgi:hypothetical protein
MIKTILAGGAGLAALAAAAPAAAQYGYANPYGYSQYGYASPYGYSNGYGYANPYAAQSTAMATQQCSAAVQSRLANRNTIGGILGAVLGANTTGRVVSVTQVTPRQQTVRVRGLASSGRYAGYGAYGVGAYGALGYGQPDLAFKCDVDYRGYVRDVDITRRY